MSNIMTHEEIFDMWKVDCVIDRTNLDNESIEIPKLHGKWLKILSAEKAVLRSLDSRSKKLKRALTRFFMDGPTTATEQLGWKMPPKGKVLKPEVAQHVDDHSDMIKAADEVAQQTEKVEVISEILKQINKRNYFIRDAIDDRRFKQGS